MSETLSISKQAKQPGYASSFIGKQRFRAEPVVGKLGTESHRLECG